MVMAVDECEFASNRAQTIIPIVSIVVPFWGLPCGILNIELVKPKKGTTMETTGTTDAVPNPSLAHAAPRRSPRTQSRPLFPFVGVQVPL